MSPMEGPALTCKTTASSANVLLLGTVCLAPLCLAQEEPKAQGEMWWDQEGHPHTNTQSRTPRGPMGEEAPQ